MRFDSSTKPSSRLSLVSYVPLNHELSYDEMRFHSTPHRNFLSDFVNDFRATNYPNLKPALKEIRSLKRAKRSGLIGYAQLRIVAYEPNGKMHDMGIASLRVVTDAGVAYMVQSFINSGTSPLDLFRFHALGTGVAAEDVTDTALQTELTTEYTPANTRATGSQGVGASANIYQTIGTNTFSAPVAITEHGNLTQAATGGGTLLDRSVFAVINLPTSGSLQTEWNLTLPSGG